MNFIPKSHVPLKDAINNIGQSKFKNWSGDELSSEIWKTGWYYGLSNEQENYIADTIASNALKEWSEDWEQAAERFFKQLNHEMFLLIKQKEIDSLRASLPDKTQAYCWMIHREAARYILNCARRRYRSTDLSQMDLYFPASGMEPPYLCKEGGSDPVELDEPALAIYEKQAENNFAIVEKFRLKAQSRFNTVTNWFRQELYDGELVVAYLKLDGELVEIPRKIWATDDSLDLFKTCKIEESDLLVSKHYQKLYEEATRNNDDNLGTVSHGKARVGAKPKYDWAAAKSHIVDMFKHHGPLSGDDPDWSRQADVENEIKKFFLDSFRMEPATSTVREKAKCFIAEVEAGNN